MRAIAALCTEERSAKEIGDQIDAMNVAASRESAAAAAGEEKQEPALAGPAAPAAKKAKLESDEPEPVLDEMEVEDVPQDDEMEEGDDLEGEIEDEDEDERDEDELPGNDVEPVSHYTEMLHILEDPNSHLVFKRLLSREAVQRPRAGHGDKEATIAAPAPADFGRSFLEVAGEMLASQARSNRACMIMVDLCNSADAQVAKRARETLAKDAALIKASAGESQGKSLLLSLLTLPPSQPKVSATTPAAAAMSSKKPSKKK
jgi:hypothetical protein